MKCSSSRKVQEDKKKAAPKGGDDHLAEMAEAIAAKAMAEILHDVSTHVQLPPYSFFPIGMVK